MKNKVLIIATLLIVGIAFGVLNFLTSEYLDDYMYKFMFIGNNADTTMPITSLKDVIISQYNHYFCFNGRTFVHFIVQIFTGILGKSTFNIITTFVFLVFIYTITRLHTKANVLDILFSSIVVLLLFPAFNDTVLWMTGSINYMWSSAFVCVFLFFIIRNRETPIKPIYLVYSILCLLIGWTHEGITFPLALSLIVYMCITYKTIYKRAVFPLMMGFVIGALLCAFSPATIGRASIISDGGINSSALIQKIISGLILCTKLKAIYCLLCIMIALFFVRKGENKIWLKEFYKKHIIVCNALIFSFGIVFLSGFTSSRTAIGAELYAIILSLYLMHYFKDKIVRKIKIGVCIMGGLFYCCIVYYSTFYYKEGKQLVSQINNNDSDIVLTNEVSLPAIVESHIRKPLENSKSEYSDWFCYKSPWNGFMAATYHRDSLVFVPSVIYNDIVNHSDNLIDIQKQKDYPFYVMPINNITDSVKPTFILNPTDFQQLPFYIRPLASRQEKYTATEIQANLSRCGIVEIDGQSFLFIGKNMMIDNRVKDISLK